MAQSLIGNLSVLLSMDTAAFENGASQASKLLRKTQRQFEQIGNKIKDVGDSLSSRVTLPIIGAGAATIKMAGDFQSSMNEVAISTQATAAELGKMRELALDIGAKTTKSASESAEAMDMMAKAGMRVEDILNGGARAAVALAEAAGSDLDPAAAAITDTMAQFAIKAAELPRIVNNITGAVNESKFDFADFQLGMAQAGGVASSAGLSFEEFTAALAGTASMFASGSDAGTSLKNFLNFLIPKSAGAAAMMEKYNLAFFDANGQMKSMAAIAEMLRKQLSGLTEEDRSAALHEIFGTDAMRTAIGLMKIGSQGFEEMNARIQATDASAQAAQRMQGFNAEMEKLGGAIETLAIRIGDSGFLAAMTSLIENVASWVDWMSEAHPATLKWGTIIAGVAAAVGPLLIVLGSVVNSVGVLLPIIVKLGPAFKILSSGVLYLTPLIWGAVKAMAAMALTPVGAIITAIAVAVGAVYLAWKNWDKITAFVSGMVTGVSAHLSKLKGILLGVLGPIETVRKGFFNLYDAVVGHSYIPDMVDGIRDQMARLDAVMVTPAKTAAERTKAEFERLQQSVSTLMDRLFPEVRALITLEKELADLQAARDKGMLTPEQYGEAITRIRVEKAKDGPQVLEGIEDLVTGPLKEVDLPKDLKDRLEIPAQKSTATVIESFANMARDVAGSLRGMVDAIKSGDILGALSGVLDIVGQVANMFGPNKSSATPTFNRGFGGFRATGGPTVPGKSYIVGENGPEWFTPGARGFVTPGANDNGTQLQVIPSPYFDVVVQGQAARVASPMAAAAQVGGSAMAQRSMLRRQQRTIP